MPRPTSPMTKPLVDAVKAFQESLGLDADGVIGPATVAALNGGAATTKEDIVANMERWRWEPSDFGDFHVFVNIPEFRLRDHGSGDRGPLHDPRRRRHAQAPDAGVLRRDRAHRRQPLLERAGLDRHQRDRAAPAGQSGLSRTARTWRCCPAARSINASAIDWTQTNINNFHIRQRPGAGNALGQIKFLFPNQHDVYLHDTPSKSLFAALLPRLQPRLRARRRTRWSSPTRCSRTSRSSPRPRSKRMFGNCETLGEPQDPHPGAHLPTSRCASTRTAPSAPMATSTAHNKRLIELLDRVAPEPQPRRRCRQARPPVRRRRLVACRCTAAQRQAFTRCLGICLGSAAFFA